MAEMRSIGLLDDLSPAQQEARRQSVIDGLLGLSGIVTEPIMALSDVGGMMFDEDLYLQSQLDPQYVGDKIGNMNLNVSLPTKAIGAARGVDPNALTAGGVAGKPKKLTRKDIDPLGFGKIVSDVPLSEINAQIDDIGLLGQRALIKPEDLQGKILLFGAGDRSGTGLLTGLDGMKFETPVEMLGGRNYQLVTPDAWASGQSVVTDLLNRAEAAQRKYDGADVVLAHSTMGRGAVDFSEMNSSTLSEMIKGSKILKKDAKEFDEEYKAIYPDFVGVKSPKLREWLENAPSGKARTVFAELMDSKKYREKGFPVVSKARYALTEPAQREVGTFRTGMSFQPIDVQRGMITDPEIIHKSYNRGIGKLDDQMPSEFEDTISTFDIYRDFYKDLEARGALLSKAGKPLGASAIQPSYRAGMPTQYVDQELVDTLSGILGY